LKGDAVVSATLSKPANLEHATRHGIKDFEIEDAVLDVESIEVEAKDVRGERREALIGSTAGGRIVVIVYTDRENQADLGEAREGCGETEI